MRRKGSRIGHNWCYHEAEARLKSRLFFALGNEGKKRFLASYPHLDLNSCSFVDFHKCCEDLFKGEQNYTVEKIKLHNTIFMQENDSFSSFYARLSAQTALCNWPLNQERATLKDLFIDRIRDVEVQRQLIKRLILMILCNWHWRMRKVPRHQSNFRNYSRILTLLLLMPVLFDSNKNRLHRCNNSRIKETAVEEEVSIVPINVKVKISHVTFAVIINGKANVSSQLTSKSG